MIASKLILAVKSLKAVFRQGFYLGLVIFLFLISLLFNFLINVIILNYDLLIFTLTSGLFSFKTQAEIFFNAPSSIAALPPVSLIAIIILSFLLAVEISLFVFYFKKQSALKREAGLGFSGLLVSFFGFRGHCQSNWLFAFRGFGIRAFRYFYFVNYYLSDSL